MLLQLVSLEGLLVFELLLRVLVPLQDLIVLLLAELEALVHLTFQLLAERVHFVLLFLHQLGFHGEDFLVTDLHVRLSLTLLEFVGPLLHLVRLLIVLLLGQVGLNLAQVEQLGRELESQRKSLFQVLAVLTKLLGVLVL